MVKIHWRAWCSVSMAIFCGTTEAGGFFNDNICSGARRPGLSLASCQLIPTAISAGASRVASGLLCLHAIAITPVGPTELVRSSISIVSGLPCVTVRSAPAIVVSGPVQRLLTLWPARSPSRLATLYTESSDRFVTSAAASIATGWSEPVPGRELHPLKPSAFPGALLRQLS